MTTEKTSGSQTATISTEHTLATVTDAGIYVLRVDLNNLAPGDVVELRLYAKARNSSDSERLLYAASYGPLSPEAKLTDSVPVVAAGHFRASLKQTAGTGRAWPWAILSTGA